MNGFMCEAAIEKTRRRRSARAGLENPFVQKTNNRNYRRVFNPSSTHGVNLTPQTTLTQATK